MKHFLVELYVPRRKASDFESEVARVRSVSDDLRSRGVPVRHLRSLFLPEEETCFHLFESSGTEAVEEAIRSAGLECERISQALDSASDVYA
ncbi:MAG: hypothetical protein ABSB96_03800 [Gaiellaceae bacterium]